MPDRCSHSGMLYCQLDSHSTRPHVLLHLLCQHVGPSEQPFIVGSMGEASLHSFSLLLYPPQQTLNKYAYS